MKPSRLPLPALHVAVVLLWAALLGASAFIVRGGRATASATFASAGAPKREPAPALLACPARSDAALEQCLQEVSVGHAKRRDARGKRPDAQLPRDATSSR
ncbi:MAG TPA: hypothetical protein VFO83_09265 [Aggregicoccus sp.]|nr:hypothetical protein [Aggregicoccus sp.]